MAATHERKSMKGYYLTTFLIGLGFFTMGLMDPLYDTYVPKFLERYIEKKALIGTIMTLDNIFAIFLIPVFAAISDRTRTKIGRRMPFIITFLPLSAIAFGLIPFTALNSLILLILMVFCLNIFKQSVRGPVVALMPDIIPGEIRSEANGVINTMGGIATIVGTLFLARLMNVRVNLPKLGPTDSILAFPLASILVVVAVVLLFLFVKESKSNYSEKAAKEKVPILKSLKMIFGEKDKSAFFVLLSLLFWFIGYQGVLPFVGLYSKNILRTSPANEALAAGMVGVSYAIFAIPSGIIAHKFGRKKTIRGALIALIVVLSFIFLHNVFLTNPSSVPEGSYAPLNSILILFWALMFLFGIFWVTVITNSFPMLWQMADYANIGIYTGLYYFFSQLASIIAPPITGALIDLFGYGALFLFAAACMLIAFICMSRVKRGEPKDDAAPVAS
ncbi:MAG: MFS transporter [Sphaerochaetaceae bacterium]|nr:MFS transporter [Sphaerochaetaceae bacterium]MDX9808696.1 MFS transporter [Sphaerochaetaceae bacterium]NLV83324.1 SLC45 family MFS transporter [Spirochaetales bacterium]